MKKLYLAGLALLAPITIVLGENVNNSQGDDPNGTFDFWVGFLFLIFVIVLVIWLVRRSNRKSRNIYYNNRQVPYNNPFENPPIQNSGPGVGDFVAGAILGAAAAEIIEDIADGNNYNQPQGSFDDSNYNADTSSYTQDDNDNSWDSGSDSSFSDDSFNDDSNF